ncbi:MAG: hypothetical protein IKU43_09970 [Clostridia bacterium]|nr:hypothetical protein [Clostridia bacterium]
MKKLLSLILAALMLVSMLPAVSYAADNRVELIYSFLKADNNNVTNATEISYETGNGLLAYYSHNTNHGTSNDFSKWDGVNASPRFSMYYWGYSNRFNYAAYHIKGIQAGVYTVTLQHALHTSGTKDVEMYILDGSVTDVKTAIDDTSNVPVLADINMWGETKSSTTVTGSFTAPKDGEYLLVFVRRSEDGSQCVIPQKLILTPYIEEPKAEYSETVNTLPELEIVGKEVEFTAKMMMSTGEVYVPEIEGDGITAMVVNGDVAEIVDEAYENGIYTAKLRMLSAGNAQICITSTYEGVETKEFYTVESIENPGLVPITIEMTKNTMVFTDREVPNENWQTEGFELVLDAGKMTSSESRYTNRVYSGIPFVQLQTGYGIWPTLSNAMFTIKKRVFTAGWYALDAKGLVIEGKAEADYSIYVNGVYAGDFVFSDETVVASSGRYIKEEKLNTVYLSEGYNEISFRARRLNASGMGYFAPYTVSFTPVEDQSGLTVKDVSSDILEMLPIGENQLVTAHIEMSDGSHRHFGLTNDGSEDSKNKIISAESDNPGVMSVSDFVAPQFGEEDTFTFRMSANAIGTAKITIKAVIDGTEMTFPIDVEVIKTPVLEKAVLKLKKDKLYIGKTLGSELSLYRSGDGKEFTGEYEVVGYRSSDAEILTVDENGNVTGVSHGTAIVYVDVLDKTVGDVITGELEVAVLEKPQIAAVTIEMTKNTMVFADKTAPNETWQTEGFELVLDADKMTTATSRYTDRKYANITFVDLFTGKGVWPELANGMFTIKKEILVPGWYSVNMRGLPLNTASDYSIYVDGRYVGDYLFYDENVATSADRYLKDTVLNTIYLDEKVVEISFRARDMHSNSSASFSPHSITFIPLDDQNDVEYSDVESSMSAMLPIGEEESVLSKVVMSDGSYRLFGLADNGKADDKNKVVSVVSEDASVAEVSSFSASKFGSASDITYTVKGKKTGKTNIVATIIVDGVTCEKKFPIEIIEKPVLSSVEVVLGRETLGVTRKTNASVKLTRSSDFKEYTYETKSIVYRSSDASVAEVDAETGEITAKKVGTATIFADVTDWVGNTVTGEKTITVTEKPILTSIKVSADTEVLVGDTSEITVEAIMDDAEAGDIENYTLRYESSNTSVATVENGVFTAVGSGKCAVSVSAVSESGKICVGVLDVTVYASIDKIVIDFPKTEAKLDYSQPDVTPGYTIRTDIGTPTQYRIFDCFGTDMLSVRTSATPWPQTFGDAKSAFAFEFEAFYDGDYGIEFYGGSFFSLANYSIYVNGKYAGDYIFHSTVDTTRRNKGPGKILNTLHLNKGKNIVVLLVREIPEKGQGYMLLRNFTFTPRSEDVTFADVEISIPDEIALGEKINLEAKVKMSDGTYRHFGPDYASGAMESPSDKITLTDSKSLTEIEKIEKIGNTDIT